MEKEFVLAAVSATIWLMLVGLIVVTSYTVHGDEDHCVKLVNAILLGVMSTAGCFALYLAMTLP
ncbi:hypothetical protein [Metapseudomonas sp. CR3202]|uniref:hypothetical protein n=1 Tax=Pseudomonas sp. CR3202 TaxID=3351532 RepID=UPI003BF4BC4B